MSGDRVSRTITSLLWRRDSSIGDVSVLAVGVLAQHFARAVLQVVPARVTIVQPAEIHGMEPHAQIEMIEACFEHAALESARFDFTCSSQPIAHLIAAEAVLAEHNRLLKHDGFLLVDAPCAAKCRRDAADLLMAAGFSVLAADDDPIGDRLFLVARKVRAMGAARSTKHSRRGMPMNARIISHAEFLSRARLRRAA